MPDETDEEKAAREAAEAQAAEDAKGAGDDPDKDADGDLTDAEKAALGEPGKQAIDRTKAKWQKERDARRALEAEVAELKKTGKPPAKAGEADAEVEAARQRATENAIADATRSANERILKSEIKAAAAGKLTDPALALKLLDLSQFEVNKDGDVDEDEIKDAIKDLLEKHPYLAAQGRGAAKFGDADAGSRGSGKPKQFTAQQVKTMTAEQVVKAQADGLLDDYLKTPN